MFGFGKAARRKTGADAAVTQLEAAGGKAAIMRFLADWSIETAPGSAVKIGNFAALLPAGTAVYVTMLPGADLDAIVALCARLRGEGLEPVPHVAARSLASHDELERYVSGLAAAGVEQALVIGGGATTPRGPFDRSMAVLETGVFERNGITRIGVAGHPEGNADIPEAEIARALAEKNAYAAATGSRLYIATQFCFDPDAIIAWDRRLRAAGNRLPIHIGIAGPAKLKSLINYATMCGVGPSLRFLTRQALNIAKLATISVPDRLVTRLAAYQAEDPDCGIERAHFFAFGGMERTSRWLAAMEAGRFTMTGDGFEMDEPLD